MPPSPQIVVEIADEQAHLPLDRRLVRKAVRRVLRDAGVRKARISVAVVDDATIARLNWQYLRHRGPADVLSFLLDESDGLEGEVVVGAKRRCGLRRNMVGRRTTSCCCTSFMARCTWWATTTPTAVLTAPKCRNRKRTYWKALE